MRTTLTLDEDVAAMLKRLRRQSSVGFKALVNDLLRAGLKQAMEPRQTGIPYRTPSGDAGRCLIGSIADTEQVLSEVEVPERR